MKPAQAAAALVAQLAPRTAGLPLAVRPALPARTNRISSPDNVGTSSTDPQPSDLVGARIIRTRVSKRTLKDLRSVSAAVETIDRLPDRDEAIHALMGGDFHGFSLVPAVLRLAEPEAIEELIVATLGFNAKNAAELLELMDSGKILRVVFVCSHYFQKSCPREFEALRAGLEARGMQITATRSHAKILGIRLSGGRCIVVESSANLRSCRNVEQFMMTESPDLFRFHAEWITKAAQSQPGKEPR